MGPLLNSHALDLGSLQAAAERPRTAIKRDVCGFVKITLLGPCSKRGGALGTLVVYGGLKCQSPPCCQSSCIFYNQFKLVNEDPA